MPHMDGFELLGRIRQDPDLQSIPVIILSARAGKDTTIEGLQLISFLFLLGLREGGGILFWVRNSILFTLFFILSFLILCLFAIPIGITTRKVLPTPSSLSSSIRPPCNFTLEEGKKED